MPAPQHVKQICYEGACGASLAALGVYEYLNTRPFEWRIVDPSKHVVPKKAINLEKEAQSWDGMYDDLELDEKDPTLPEQLGAIAVMTTYYDSNWSDPGPLCLQSTGSGLIFLGNFPVEWWSKRIAAITGSSHHAEFMAAKMAVYKTIDARTVLHQLGCPVEKGIRFLGDNEAVVKSISRPNTVSTKKHVSIAYYTSKTCKATVIWSHSGFRGSKIHRIFLPSVQPTTCSRHIDLVYTPGPRMIPTKTKLRNKPRINLPCYLVGDQIGG